MRLTAHEILLIVVVLSVLLVGAAVKRYRNNHSPADSVPAAITER